MSRPFEYIGVIVSESFGDHERMLKRTTNGWADIAGVRYGPDWESEDPRLCLVAIKKAGAYLTRKGKL